MSEPGPRVVIVGGGFGGLAAAKALRKAPTQNVLIDRTNHHVFSAFALSGGNLGARSRTDRRSHSVDIAKTEKHDRDHGRRHRRG